jgi:hypothetical protein
METEIKKTLPKIMKGSVHAQFVRCGKQNCKCASGELHGPYFYHFVRFNGELKKRYLKVDEVEQVQAACRTRQQAESEQRASDRTFWANFRAFRAKVREPKTVGDLLSGGNYDEF